MKTIALVLCLLSSCAFGQTDPYAPLSRPSVSPIQAKIGVYISCTCEDQVGALYATALRDAIAASPRFTEVSQPDEKGADGKISKYNWVLAIVTIDDAQPATGMSTAISVVMNLGDTFFMSQWIQTCGRDVVAGCASSTLANFDAKLHK